MKGHSFSRAVRVHKKRLGFSPLEGACKAHAFPAASALVGCCGVQIQENAGGGERGDAALDDILLEREFAAADFRVRFKALPQGLLDGLLHPVALLLAAQAFPVAVGAGERGMFEHALP